MVATSVCLTLAMTGEQGSGLPAPIRAVFSPCDPARRATHGRGSLSARSWSLVASTCRKGCKRPHTEINAYRTAHGRARQGSGKFGRDADVPATVAAADAHLTQPSAGGERTMPLHLDAADALEANSPLLSDRHPTGMAFQRPDQRVEARTRLEARVSRLLSAGTAAIKRLKRAVESAQHCLLTPNVHRLGWQQIRSIAAQRRELSRLGGVVNRDAVVLPSPAALLQRCVVELAPKPELGLKRLPLLAGRVQAIAVRASHEHMFAPPTDGRRCADASAA